MIITNKNLINIFSSVRKRESSNTVVENDKRNLLFQAKKIKSHIVQINNEDYITMKQIPSLE